MILNHSEKTKLPKTPLQVPNCLGFTNPFFHIFLTFHKSIKMIKECAAGNLYLKLVSTLQTHKITNTEIEVLLSVSQAFLHIIFSHQKRKISYGSTPKMSINSFKHFYLFLFILTKFTRFAFCKNTNAYHICKVILYFKQHILISVVSKNIDWLLIL